MILAYYYILCSMPMLRREGPPPVTSEQFLNVCSQMIPKKKVEQLAGLRLLPERENAAGPSASATRWYRWETDMRERLAKFRAVSLGRENKNPGDGLSDIDRRIEEILAVPNPAERERMLDGLRWKALEEIEFGHNFDFDSLCVYRIRLMLLEKWAGKDKNRGYENLDAILSKIKRPDISFPR